MITQITDTERKLQTQINLLTATNEGLAKRAEIALDCLPDAPYRDMLRALFADMAAERDALTDEVELKTICIRGMRVEAKNLAQQRDALTAKVEKLELDNDPDALTIAYMAGVERGKERVQALEADATINAAITGDTT